jgi:hypothetical protein
MVGKKIDGGVTMSKKAVWGAIFISLVMTGCAAERIYKSSPPMRTVSNNLYEAKLEPLRAEGYNYYNQFRFEVTNKSDKDLIVNWSQTFYLQNGKRYGRFGWDGLTFEELRGIQDEPDLRVAAGNTQTSVIFPLQLLGWKEEGVRMKATTPEAGFTLGVIPEGENGMELAVKQDGKLVREKILVNITLN